MKSKKLCLALMLSALSLFVGCSGSGGGDSGGSSTGTLALSLQDATSEEYRAVYVTIDAVEVHLGGDTDKIENWADVLSADKAGKTYNLLELVNGVREELGLTDLEAKPYTQMRLIIGTEPDDGVNVLNRSHPFANYVITEPDLESYELKVPSGLQTGIKIVHGFEINQNLTTELVLDFVVSESVVEAGNSGNWLLKPTIKVKSLPEHTLVQGKVIEDKEAPETVIPGALVTAQQVDSNGNPVVFASTISDEYGSFALLINPNPEEPVDGLDQFSNRYNIVAYQKKYVTNCVEVATAIDLKATPVVKLAGPIATGTIKGSVTIGNGNDLEKYVTLSFRQKMNCNNANESNIEVKAENIQNGTDYSKELTEGSYDVVASTYDEVNDKPVKHDPSNVEIKKGTPVELLVIFP